MRLTTPIGIFKNLNGFLPCGIFIQYVKLIKIFFSQTQNTYTFQEHEWVTAGGKEPLPSEQENCRLVEVTDEDMARVVTSIPNLSTLILIKTMLKKHSFQVLD